MKLKGLMQIGIIVENVDEAVKNYEAMGVGQGIGGLMDYSYLDLRKDTGLIIECYKSLQPDKPILTKSFKGEKRS